MKKGILLAFALAVAFTAHAQLYTPELKVQGTETKVLGSNGSFTKLRGDRFYVYPGDGSSTEIRGSAVFINRNHSICGAQLQFRRQGNVDWSLKNSEDNCGMPGGMHFLNTSRETKMTILQNGNVGIGYSNPSYKLHVDGSVLANNVSISSDQRLKRDIKEYSTGLALVKQVKVKKYKYKAPQKAFSPNTQEDDFYEGVDKKALIQKEEDSFYQQDQIGVLAQELQQIAPDLVGSYTDEDGQEMLTINHTALTFILINAVKELSAQVDELQTELDKKKQK